MRRRLPPFGFAGFLLAVLVLPNLLFATAGQFIFFQRAAVNIDYLLLGIAAMVLGRRFWPLWLLFLSVLLLDLVFALAPAYHLSLNAALRSITDVTALGGWFVLIRGSALVLVAGLIAAATAMLLKRVEMGRRGLAGGIGLVIVLVALNAWAHQGVSVLGRTIAIPNLTTSTLNSLRVSATTIVGDRSAGRPVKYGVESAAMQVWQDWPPAARDEAFILVVVESMGQFTDAQLNRLQWQPLLSLLEQQELEHELGSVAFAGSTVAGELRELCGVYYPTVEPVMEGPWLSECLPLRAKQNGYTTMAAHGFLGSFFARSVWYPELAFDRIYFAPELLEARPSMQRCGSAFNGICDQDALAFALDQVRQRDGPVFLHFLSLTAHLPVPIHPHQGQRAEFCRRHETLLDDPALCHLLLWHVSLLEVLADAVEGGGIGPARIVVVGDHPPPYLESARRDLFSATRVPYLAFRLD